MVLSTSAGKWGTPLSIPFTDNERYAVNTIKHVLGEASHGIGNDSAKLTIRDLVRLWLGLVPIELSAEQYRGLQKRYFAGAKVAVLFVGLGIIVLSPPGIYFVFDPLAYPLGSWWLAAAMFYLGYPVVLAVRLLRENLSFRCATYEAAFAAITNAVAWFGLSVVAAQAGDSVSTDGLL